MRLALVALLAFASAASAAGEPQPPAFRQRMLFVYAADHLFLNPLTHATLGGKDQVPGDANRLVFGLRAPAAHTSEVKSSFDALAIPPVVEVGGSVARLPFTEAVPKDYAAGVSIGAIFQDSDTRLTLGAAPAPQRQTAVVAIAPKFSTIQPWLSCGRVLARAAGQDRFRPEPR